MKRNLEDADNNISNENFKHAKDHNSKLSDEDYGILIGFLKSLENSTTARYAAEDIKQAINQLEDGEDIDEIMLFVRSDTPFLEGNLPLIHHSILGKNYQAFDVLLNNTDNINISDPQYGTTPLHLAVSMGDLYSVKALVQNPNTNLETKSGANGHNNTPIAEAWIQSNNQIYFELAKHGANINSEGQYDFYEAEANGNIVIKLVRGEIKELKKYIQSFDKLISNEILSDQEVLNINLESNKLYKEVASRRLDTKLIKEFSDNNISTLSNKIREFYNKVQHHKIEISYLDNFPLLKKYFGEEESYVPKLSTLCALTLKNSGVDELHYQHKEIKDFYSDFSIEMSGLSLDQS